MAKKHVTKGIDREAFKKASKAAASSSSSSASSEDSLSAIDKEFREAEGWLAKAAAAGDNKLFGLERVLFGKQLAFVQDQATFGDAVCSRRAGKSVGIAAWLLEGPILNPTAPSLYFTITRKSAKRIIWSTMLELNAKYSLGYEPREGDLTLRRGGLDRVYLTGVDNRNEIEKIRGTGWGRAAGDEAQTLPEYMRDLTEDVLMPSFMDHDGKLRFTGTPGAVPAGFFHEISHSSEWAHHHWTVWDNPHIKEESKRGMLERVLRVRGVSLQHPSIRREWFGEWALDLDALVFKYDPAKNGFNGDLKQYHMVEPWQYVFGVDLGFDDSDAIAVLAFNRGHPGVFLVEESVVPKQSISQLTDRIRSLQETYKPISIVVDTGGLGKKIAEEVGSRTGLPLQPAEKQRKFEFIELLNDSMRSGRFFATQDSRFAADTYKVEWDRERSRGERLVISGRFHSDVCDAVLYAFRESLHWLHKDAPTAPDRGSPAWAKQQEKLMFEKTAADIKRSKTNYDLGDFGSADAWGAGSIDDWGF